jgi:hypothetical protein
MLQRSNSSSSSNSTCCFRSCARVCMICSTGAVFQGVTPTSHISPAQPHLCASRMYLHSFGPTLYNLIACRFAFPALKPPQPFQQRSAEPLAAAYPQQQLQQQICSAADAWRAAAAAVHGDSSSNSSVGPDMFCLMQINRATSNVQTAPLASWHEFKPQSQQQPSSSAAAAAGPDAHSNVQQQQQQQGDDELLLVMFDPCHLPLTPGWPLRNVLLLAAARWGVRQLHVLCVRDSSAGRAAAERSYVLQVRLAWFCCCSCIYGCVLALVGWQ